MDDLDQQIRKILSDPQSMKQLQEMAAALGLGTPEPSETAVPGTAVPGTSVPDAGALAGLLSSFGGGAPQSSATPETLQMIGRLAPLLGQLNREDDSTRLLRALRPLLSAPRQKKLDEALKILQVLRLLPLLKEGGLLTAAGR